jgi:alkylresorcinol/alkylpyrone synthase
MMNVVDRWDRADALQLPAGALDASWESLRKVGNLSSASVLLVLEDFIRK